jgi:hypothetical protein
MPPLWIDETAATVVREIGLEKVRDAWDANLPGEIVNDRGDRQVVRIVHPRTGGVYYLKRWRFSPKSLYRYLPGGFSPRKRAASELRNLRDLQSAGIAVPRPLAFGETQGLWGTVESFLLLANLDGYVSCLEWGKAHPEDLCRIAEGVARVMGILHNEGIYHRSPGLKHFYLKPDSDSGPFALLDVPRLDRDPSRFWNRIKAWLTYEIPTVERDLSKVLLGLREDLSLERDGEGAFWRAYFAARGLHGTEDDLISRVVESSEARRMARKRRKQRKRRFSGE